MAEDPPPEDASWTNLAGYTAGDYDPGRGGLARLIWHFVSAVFFESSLFPVTGPKRALLRAFGAQIGRGVVVKPNVRIKYPWRLSVGEHAWIGQEVWIDNLADVRIGAHACISQRAYLCTGSHDHRRRGFDLRIGEIEIGPGAWVTASVIVLSGASIGANTIVTAGSVVHSDVPPAKIVGGNPAQVLSDRKPPS